MNDKIETCSMVLSITLTGSDLNIIVSLEKAELKKKKACKLKIQDAFN